MKPWQQALMNAVGTGQIAAVGTALAAAGCGYAENRDALAPLNAISHIVNGDEAFAATRVSLRHTLTGLMLNGAASVSWAALYELVFGEAVEAGNVPAALAGGAVISALAYVTDYHVVPKRLTPGFERHLSGHALFLVYVVLALCLGVGGLRRKA